MGLINESTYMSVTILHTFLSGEYSAARLGPGMATGHILFSEGDFSAAVSV